MEEKLLFVEIKPVIIQYYQASLYGIDVCRMLMCSQILTIKENMW